VTTKIAVKIISHGDLNANGGIPENLEINRAMKTIELMCKNWSTKYGTTTQFGLVTFI
jgi:hypothetical protein